MSDVSALAILDRPAASVVVLSPSGAPGILDTLEILAASPAGVEVLVVSRGPLPAATGSRFPGARIVELPAGSPLPVLRAHGLREARGERIAVLGEHLRPASGWLDAVRALDDRSVAGGPVEAGRLSGLAEWAFFLLEYAPFLPPLESSSRLAGSNCAYGRQGLAVVPPPGDAVFDGELHESLRHSGVPMAMAPALLARCEKRLSPSQLLAQRYHCARVSAARRARGWPGWKRVAFALAAPLLPLLLLVRLVVALARKGRHGGALARCLPLVLLALGCGAAGEAVGALAGAGRSGERAE